MSGLLAVISRCWWSTKHQQEHRDNNNYTQPLAIVRNESGAFLSLLMHLPARITNVQVPLGNYCTRITFT